MDRALGLIIFGGTFDPPHAGHAACLMAIATEFPESRILVIPAAAPPPTAGKSKTPWLAFSDRVELCEIMIRKIDLASRATVSRIEESLPSPNYTVNTLEALRHEYAASSETQRMALTMGADQFSHFGSWHKPERILELADLIIVPRGNTPLAKLESPSATPPRIWTLEVATSPAASSAIRSAIQNQQPIPAGWLLPEVHSRLQQLTSKAIETLPR